MIRLLVKLGKWLDSRFPAKVVVLESDYEALWRRVKGLEGELSLLRDEAKVHERDISVAVDRVGGIEAKAVHKGAVQDLVRVVAELKADLASFKTSIGFRTQPVNDELQAVLNGEYINGQE